MKTLERLFEGALWSSRYIVVVAVIASMAAAFAVFYMATVDVWLLVQHVSHYADGSLTAAMRKAMHDETITHVVEVVDGYLLGLVLLIFSLGMYELFVSDIDAARDDKASSKILVIESLDDLKNRLAKVILMILIVLLFEHAVATEIGSALDILFLGGAIALVGVALFLSHRADHHEAPAAHDDADVPVEAPRVAVGGRRGH